MTRNFAILVSALFILISCIDTGKDALAPDAPTIAIQARAFIASEGSSLFQESDTIHPGDSILLFGDIAPTSAVMTRETYWNIDSLERASNYFTTKWAFENSGLHYAVFVVIDRHGDTLKDTAQIWVSTTPQLARDPIPSTHTWAIPYNAPGGVRFQWTGIDPDPNANLTYRFLLTEQDQGQTALVTDTLLKQSWFTWQNPLKALTLYRWTVWVTDEFGFDGSNSLNSDFSTAGNGDEGALDLWIARMPVNIAPKGNIHVTYTRVGGFIDSLIVDSNSWSRISPIAPGDYRIRAQDLDHPEYTSFDSVVRVLPSQRIQVEFQLKDKTSPTIQCVQCQEDTVSNGLPVQFTLADHGCGIKQIDSVLIDGLAVSHQVSALKDSLSIPSPYWEIVPGTHELTFTVQDCASNKRSARYWLEIP